jgi:hypothetical protein
VKLFRICGLAVIFVMATDLASAQATRTWVSGVGDDANPCSRTAPCKTFAGAISKTAAYGEIDALDPGGFGAVTITKSITIDGGGNIAGVLTSGTNGIVVSAGATDTVVLRNLDIDGLQSTPATNKGIVFSSGKQLIIDHCNIYGYSFRGVSIETNATGALALISNSLIHDQGNNGIVLATGTTAKVVLNNVQSVNNVGTGVVVASGSLQARESVFSNNGVGLDVHDTGSAAFESVMVSNNNVGLQLWGSGPLAWLSNTTLIQNGVGYSVAAGTAYSFQNNKLAENSYNSGSFTPISVQ